MMLELEGKEICLHQPAPDFSKYTLDKKLFDFISLISAPNISRSTAAYGRIQRRHSFEKTQDLKRLEKRKSFKFNSFDEHIFLSSQQNKGILTQKAIDEYAKAAFTSDESKKAFLDYAKFRLGYLAYLGFLNDATEDSRFYEEKVILMDGKEPKEHTAKLRVNYRYEVNNNIYPYLLEFRKQKEKELKEKFEFSGFDAYIYSFIQKNNNRIDLDAVKQEKLRQALENADKILHQVKLMKELGYLEEKKPDAYSFQKGLKEKLDNGSIYLNTAEKKIVEFIERHGIFSLDKYRIEREVEAENYAGILKNRLNKLIKLGFVKQDKDTYSFTRNGETRLKAYYAESYEFSPFDRNILNNHRDDIIDPAEIEAELLDRYGSQSAAQTLERQKERLFIMECAGLVRKEADGVYSLTEKAKYILDEENRIYTEEKRELLKQAFQYSESDEEFYTLIKSRGGTIQPKDEINNITDSTNKDKGMIEVEAYNMIMQNYKCLGTADIDADDEVKLNVKLGYIVRNEDSTLSLTPKGKNLINAVHMMDSEKRLKAFSNKKVKLLNDIDYKLNRLDPKIYIKTQRLIADREKRKTVNLLRYKPERLYLLGLLHKNEDGSYIATDLYDNCSSEFRQKKLQEDLDSFHFSNVHKFILKFCRNNEFSLEAYKEYISKKLSGKNLDREMSWKKSSLEKLTRLGFFEKKDDNVYRLTEKGVRKLQEIREEERERKQEKYTSERENPFKEFKPGANHKYLLKFARDGILDFKDVEDRIAKLPKSKQARELTMKRGMLKKLADAGYLEIIDNEEVAPPKDKNYIRSSRFRLTEKGTLFLEGKSPEPESGPEYKSIPKEESVMVQQEEIIGTEINAPFALESSIENIIRPDPDRVEIKITKFDLDNIIAPSRNNMLSKDTVEQSPKKISILKRINTLENSGLLLECPGGWELTENLLKQAEERKNINIEHEKSHSKQHSLLCLTAEQKKVITDMKDFLNLSGSQILKNIYNGNEIQFRSDLRYMLDKDILKKDRRYDIYVFTAHGKKLASELTGDHNIFDSKISTRREELRHDVMVYSAFKNLEENLLNEGKVIVSYMTDRQLRSADMKKNNTLAGEYPDVHVVYRDEKTGGQGFINLEVDVGYNSKEIQQKLKIPNLRWYTNSEKQREKVLKKARYMDVRIIGEEYWR